MGSRRTRGGCSACSCAVPSRARCATSSWVTRRRASRSAWSRHPEGVPPWPTTPPTPQERAAYADATPRAFWLDRLPPRDPTPLEREAETDLLIVGAGFTGLWAALHAKRRDPGRDVLVADAGRAGGGPARQAGVSGPAPPRPRPGPGRGRGERPQRRLRLLVAHPRHRQRRDA